MSSPPLPSLVTRLRGISSPSNHESTLTNTTIHEESSSPASSDDDFPEFNAYTPRGQSPSSLHSLPRSSPAITINAAAADFRRTQSASASIPSKSGTGNRGRSLSPAAAKKSREPSPAPSAGLDASWWGLPEKSSLPWKDQQPKPKQSIPASQVEGYEHTQRRVALAVLSCLGNVLDVGHELLSIGVDLLELAPVPGLAPAARTLLNIWDAVGGVDVNFNGCLRLTERCAELLISIRQEVREAGDIVVQELHAPVSKLEETFVHILEFMKKQVRRPFLKRFLKREEIQQDLHECDVALRDALSLFGISVQIRIFKQVQETERQRKKDTEAIINAVIAKSISGAPARTEARLSPISLSMDDEDSAASPTSPDRLSPVTHIITTSNALGLSDQIDRISIPPENILPVLATLQESQNSLDHTNDIASLRQLMHRAIQANSEAELVEILQVKHEQMPDAIKTLQRALEHVVEKRGSQSPADVIPPGVVISKIKRRFSVKGGDGSEGGLQRSKTVVSIESTTSSTKSTNETGSGSGGSRRTRDTLEQEFIESGISALVRMSQGQNTNLPSWTITKYEVNREKRIGVGGFSEVYRGTWKGKIVAIKVLKLETDKKLFIREVEIWKTLHHPHVLELYGASSASAPPWFFVSPYQKHGSLVDYLKKVARDFQDPTSGASRYFRPDRTPKKTATIPLPFRTRDTPLTPPARESSLGLPITGLTPPKSPPKSPSKESFKTQQEWDLFRFMHEIAKGMEYLHDHGVLHGDLKAANVLVDDSHRCVITDFGQSEMRSTAYGLTGKQPPRGTLRWQAPELWSSNSKLTRETDVYAFGISCVEIVNMGKLPWGSLLEDEVIRNMVLKENSRPSVADESRFNTPSLQEILKLCWHRDPGRRPQFSKIARDFKILRKNFEHEDLETPQAPLATLPEEPRPSSPTPDMRPGALPPLSPPPIVDILDWPSGDNGHPEETVANDGITMPEPVFFTAQVPGPPANTESGDDVSDDIELIDLNFYPQAALVDANTAAVWNERRYRLLLTHDHNQYLVLPLWHPSAVTIGAVGYLDKPRGEFITLFNALSPQLSDHRIAKSLPSIWEYGKVEVKNQKQEKRTFTLKGWDSIVGLLRRGKNDHKEGGIPITRRYTFPLRNGHVAAHLVAQTTEYRYMDEAKAAKQWFKAHIDSIMKAYPTIQREDFCLVIGLLRTPNYALFVSHRHPDGHVHFNAYKSPKVGQPWGTFTTDNASHGEPGPSYDDGGDARPRIEASKVSSEGGPWDTVLISRLRFRADEEEPTWKL